MNVKKAVSGGGPVYTGVFARELHRRACGSLVNSIERKV